MLGFTIAGGNIVVVIDMRADPGGFSRLDVSVNGPIIEDRMVRNSPLAVAGACLQAYVNNDRSAIETLLDDNFHFTSPIDNALDRATYLNVCWPNSVYMTGFDRLYELEDGEHAFIVYEAHTSTGKQFRNSEVHTVRNGKLVAT